MRRTFAWGVLLAGLLCTAPAMAVRNFQLQGKNELSGGIGFQSGLTDWTPGGFKWFNDYSRMLSNLVWLNFQLNLATGGNGGGWGTCYDKNGRPYSCGHYNNHFGGTELEFAAGVKLKWRLRPVPLQFHVKLGGNLAGVFLNYNGVDTASGLNFGFRGGFGARYFVIPTLGVGLELVHTLGPVFFNHNVGTQFHAGLDLNIGIEWRF